MRAISSLLAALTRLIAVACLAFGLITDAQAMRTTYFWGGDPTEREDTLFHDCDETATAALFPELCGASGPALLSVMFAHGEPIPNWSTNGCGEAMPELCAPIVYDTILRVVISGYATFTPNEVLAFEGADFLGFCPVGVVSCERAPPFISILAVDGATGTQADGFGFGGQFWTIALSFADGREYDWGGFWSRGFTVPEPGTLALLVLGLLALACQDCPQFGVPSRQPRELRVSNVGPSSCLDKSLEMADVRRGNYNSVKNSVWVRFRLRRKNRIGI